VQARVHGEHGRDAVDPHGHSTRRRWIRRIYRPFVTRYVTVSPDLEIYLRDAIGVPRQRIDQIYNGVDCDVFAPSSARAAIEGCPFDPARFRLIGTVGRMDPVKNHTGLVRAFARLVQVDPLLAKSLRLVIVGEGSERARIEAELVAAGMRDLAWLPGERQDVAAILRALDIFVLPSSGEGVSNVILEAMATALPVVATNVGANAELVADGTTGRIAAMDDEALVQAIAPYARDPALARAHGQAGRARVEQRFSLDRMIERYHRLYLELVAGLPSSRPSADTFTPQVRR
jgi:sugar transferase (PEP-CTERM/EpsH1 system associated)